MKYIFVLVAFTVAACFTVSCKKQGTNNAAIASPAAGNWQVSVDRTEVTNVDTLVPEINGTDTTYRHTTTPHTKVTPTYSSSTTIASWGSGCRISNFLVNTPAYPDTATIGLTWQKHDPADNAEVYSGPVAGCCNDMGNAWLRYYPGDSISIYFSHTTVLHGQPTGTTTVSVHGKRM